MKKTKVVIKRRKRYKKVSKYQSDRRKRFKASKRKRNLAKYPNTTTYRNKISERKQEKLKKNDSNWRDKSTVRIIDTPSVFSLTESPEDLVIWLHKLKRTLSKSSVRYIIIDLSEVQKIDIGALFVLQCAINDNRIRKGKGIRGKKPKNQECLQLYNDSSFETFFNRNSGVPNSSNEHNTYLIYGDKKTEGDMDFVHQQMSFVNNRTSCGMNFLSGLYNVMGELMANTIQWADSKTRPKYEPWNCYSYYDSNSNKTSFIWIDHGIGIIERLSGSLRYIGKRIRLRSKHDMILQLMREEDVSSWSTTKLKNRGEGLPSIYREYHERKRIANLVVLTNDVYLNFDKSIFKTYRHQFNGTVVYWEIYYGN